MEVDVAAPQADWTTFPRHWPVQADLLTWCHEMNGGTAALLVMGGIVYLLFGFYIYKYLVLANAAIIGAWIGAVLGEKSNGALLGGVLGAFLGCAITWPTMKYAVAVMGGLFGALLGASIWNAVGLEHKFAWAGALSGLIAFGMLSFILFRGSIMMYMSLQGSVMLIFGLTRTDLQIRIRRPQRPASYDCAAGAVAARDFRGDAAWLDLPASQLPVRQRNARQKMNRSTVDRFHARDR